MGIIFSDISYFAKGKRILRDPRLRRRIFIYKDANWKLHESFPHDQTNDSLKECLKSLLYIAEKDLKDRNYFVPIKHYCNLINCLDMGRLLDLYKDREG